MRADRRAPGAYDAVAHDWDEVVEISYDRFGYRPARLHRGGRVLVPTLADRWTQVIDVRDLAAWIAAAGPAGLTGAVDAVGTVQGFADLLADELARGGERERRAGLTPAEEGEVLAALAG